MTNFIRQVRAYEGETVEIAWRTKDGSTFYQRLTIPPKATRAAREPQANREHPTSRPPP